MTADYTIRFARKSDVGTILGLIRELAEYEKLDNEVVATEAVLEANMFGRRRYAECLLVETEGKPIGFALFFHNFSSLQCKPGLYIEDVYVKPEYRGRGIGYELFAQLSQIALKRDCGRQEWMVLDWNSAAIEFYHRKLNATAMNEWTKQRLTRDQMTDLAGKTTRRLTKGARRLKL